MGVSAENYDISFCKQTSHNVSCSVVLVLPMVVPVAIFVPIIREKRSMAQDESVSCTLCLLEKPFDCLVIRFVEIYGDEGVRTYAESKVNA